MTNSVDPDQLASPTDLDIHCLQRWGTSGFSRTRVKVSKYFGYSKYSILQTVLFRRTVNTKCQTAGVQSGLASHWEVSEYCDYRTGPHLKR